MPLGFIYVDPKRVAWTRKAKACANPVKRGQMLQRKKF